MKKQNYSAPALEQVKMEAEMPVMAGSATPGGKSVGGTLSTIANW